jgi:hypothetical protein
MVSWQPDLYRPCLAESLAAQSELFGQRPDDVKPAPPRHTCGGLFAVSESDCPACTKHTTIRSLKNAPLTPNPLTYRP